MSWQGEGGLGGRDPGRWPAPLLASVSPIFMLHGLISAASAWELGQVLGLNLERGQQSQGALREADWNEK